jgi:hypothetical protein
VLKYGPGAGINELTFHVQFENPVNTELSLLGDTEFTTIQVTDLSGKSIIFKSTGANHFVVSTLPAGYYVLTAVDQQVVRKRFVKM